MGVVFARLAHPYQPSPEGLPGRPAHRPFRGLLSVHSRCGPHTRAVTVHRDQLSEGFRHFVSSMPAPVASGWSVSPGGTCTHWKAPPCHGAHPLRTFGRSVSGFVREPRGPNGVRLASAHRTIAEDAHTRRLELAKDEYIKKTGLSPVLLAETTPSPTHRTRLNRLELHVETGIQPGMELHECLGLLMCEISPTDAISLRVMLNTSLVAQMPDRLSSGANCPGPHHPSPGPPHRQRPQLHHRRGSIRLKLTIAVSSLALIPLSPMVR